jgi:hypothetical protein
MHRQAEASEEELRQWPGHSASATAEGSYPFGGKGSPPGHCADGAPPDHAVAGARGQRGPSGLPSPLGFGGDGKEEKGRRGTPCRATAACVAVTGGTPSRRRTPLRRSQPRARVTERGGRGETPPCRLEVPLSPAMGRRRAGRRGSASSSRRSGRTESGEEGLDVRLGLPGRGRRGL